MNNGLQGFSNDLISPAVATGGIISLVNEYRVHKFLSSENFVVTADGEIEFLLVGGGGGGGSDQGGGGGGGHVFYARLKIFTGVYPVVVGDGGSYGSVSTTYANSGQASSFNMFVAPGGSGGFTRWADSNTRSGGNSSSHGYYSIGNYINNDYVGGNGNGDNYGGGGGAGASKNGESTGSVLKAGNGGDGFLSLFLGTHIRYGGGGGGGNRSGTGQGLGKDGGGNGGYNSNGTAGSANTGGGGGGGSWSGSVYYGANGGSGIVLIRYLA